ncbi:uncharacterized protein LOC100905734 [Galendromus occidentalis]|uniref:Uncharacterized protein LOC100905734 n=1 Tax=Galendromus occidentalis TaxID=34638 RepID=A0AAJ6VZS4_9ACAR|nr:uncharacterized protein LOC100905734 [Galendromus occidentalis]
MSLMEHTASHSVTLGNFNRTASSAAMETTQIGFPLDDDEAGFDWIDENLEIDPNVPIKPMGTDRPDVCDGDKSRSAPIQTALDSDSDKTHAVELRSEQTESVKNEVLKVASKFFKSDRTNEEAKSALDIFGINAALNSQTGRQEKQDRVPPEPEVSTRPTLGEVFPRRDRARLSSIENQSSSSSSTKVESAMDQSGASERSACRNSTESRMEDTTIGDNYGQTDDRTASYEESDEDMSEGEASIEMSRCRSSQESIVLQSESWCNLTGVKNLELDEESGLTSFQPTLPVECMPSQSSFSQSCDQENESTIDADDCSNITDEREPTTMHQSQSPTFVRPSLRSSVSSVEMPKPDWTLEQWIQYDPETFSIFAEPIVEREPIPKVVRADKQILQVDRDRLRKAVTLEPDAALEEFIKREKLVMRNIKSECEELLKKLKTRLEQMTAVLIDSSPFYEVLPPENFKISTDKKSETVTVR